MASKGTLDREDDLPQSMLLLSSGSSNNNKSGYAPSSSSLKKQQQPRLRQTLALRHEVEDEEEGEEEEAMSQGSELMNESVVSSVTDKYGFMSGTDQSIPDQQPQSNSSSSSSSSSHHNSSVEVQRRRERKWLEMLRSWDAYMLKNYKKVRERCRKGIPTSVRAKAWLHLCGAQHQMTDPSNRNEFRRLHNQRGNQKWIDDIEKDLHRNFPTHEMFGGAYERIGQAELYRVLKAYSVLNPVDGYCQAMAPLAALLLMSMPAEEAFWCLVAICDKYIPGYYSPGMEAIQLDGDILFGLLKRVSPSTHKHLRKQGIEPVLYMTEWFLCAFARTLPWPSVMRVWDMFMCEGVKVLFRVALVLIRSTLTRSVRKRCPTMFETLDALKHLPAKVTQEDFLVEEVLRLDVSVDDMEREHRKQLKRRTAAAAAAAATAGGSQHQL